MRKIVYGLTSIGVLLIISYVLFPYVAPAFARYLIKEDPLEHADAILILGAERLERTHEAAMLYREGWAPTIVVAPVDNREGIKIMKQLGVTFPLFSDIQRSVLQQMGVSGSAIMSLEGIPRSTAEEARMLDELARKKAWRRVIIVTSSYHTRRARSYFRNETDGRVEIICRRPRLDFTAPDHWWKDPMQRLDVVLEYVKLPKLWRHSILHH